jgi:hypothetical protein
MDARKCPSRISSTHLRVYTSLVPVVGPEVVLYRASFWLGYYQLRDLHTPNKTKVASILGFFRHWTLE